MKKRELHVYDHVTRGDGCAVLPDTARCGKKIVGKDGRPATRDLVSANLYQQTRRAIAQGDLKELIGASFCGKCVRGLAALLLALSLFGCAGIPVRDVAAAGGSVAGSLTPEPIAALVAPIVAPVARAAEEMARQREEQGNTGLWTTILAAVGAAGSGFVAARGRRTTSHVDELYDETKQLGAKVAALEGQK